MIDRPSVLFVCVKNAGKSQMAAGLMREIGTDTVDVFSAGTRPGEALNALSVQSLAEIGIDITDDSPKPVDRELLHRVSRVIVLGTEARLEAPDGVKITTWVTDEPAMRGIEGIERMRLVRDDIARRVAHLHGELTADTP